MVPYSSSLTDKFTRLEFKSNTRQQLNGNEWMKKFTVKEHTGQLKLYVFSLIYLNWDYNYEIKCDN